MSKMLPPYTPQQKPDVTTRILRDLGVPDDAVSVLVVRGYYKITMGDPTCNDRRLYDDAVFINSPRLHMSFNANADPGGYRKGYGKSEKTKGMARLKPGVYKYKIGMHRGQYLALVQAGPVTVIRDGNPDYEDTGHFGIHCHPGGITKVSSEGCITIPPGQWKKYFNTIRGEMDHFKSPEIYFCLVEV